MVILKHRLPDHIGAHELPHRVVVTEQWNEAAAHPEHVLRAIPRRHDLAVSYLGAPREVEDAARVRPLRRLQRVHPPDLGGMEGCVPAGQPVVPNVVEACRVRAAAQDQTPEMRCLRHRVCKVHPLGGRESAAPYPLQPFVERKPGPQRFLIPRTTVGRRRQSRRDPVHELIAHELDLRLLQVVAVRRRDHEE